VTLSRQRRANPVSFDSRACEFVNCRRAMIVKRLQMVFRSVFGAVLLALMFLPASLKAQESASLDYRLHVQDKIRIRVFEWRDSPGELYEWSAVNGELVVGASGMVSLPLIGETSATGKTPAEFAAVISERLQAKVGLVQRPSVIVEVLAYRPFYVVGIVERPGEYAFRPGMTVMQAIGAAGGLQRPGSQSSWQIGRDATSARGDLSILTQTANRLIARQARLEAELKSSETIAFPPELQNGDDNSISDIKRDEQLIFESRRDAFQQKVEMLKKHRALLEQEISLLQAQIRVKSKQQDSMETELSGVRSLVKKGLQTAPRQSILERGAAVFEIGRLELETSVLRSRQQVAGVDEDILDMKSRRQNEILAELQQVGTSRQEILEKVKTAQELIRQAEAAGAQPQVQPTLPAGIGSVEIVIHRGDKPLADQPALDLQLEPGDVVDVRPLVLESMRKTTVGSNLAPDNSASVAQR